MHFFHSFVTMLSTFCVPEQPYMTNMNVYYRFIWKLECAYTQFQFVLKISESPNVRLFVFSSLIVVVMVVMIIAKNIIAFVFRVLFQYRFFCLFSSHFM